MEESVTTESFSETTVDGADARADFKNSNLALSLTVNSPFGVVLKRMPNKPSDMIDNVTTTVSAENGNAALTETKKKTTTKKKKKSSTTKTKTSSDGETDFSESDSDTCSLSTSNGSIHPDEPQINQNGHTSPEPPMPSVKQLKETYCNQVLRRQQSESHEKTAVHTGVSIKDLRRSYGDLAGLHDDTHYQLRTPPSRSHSTRASHADLTHSGEEVASSLRKSVSTPRLDNDTDAWKSSLSKSGVDADFINKKIHVRSVDTAQVQMKFNRAAGENEAAKLCKLCNRQVFQMEQVKAEKAVWHKSCFKCHECGKQLTVDTYSSHEGVLYCKPHFKSLFQPKAVFDNEESVPSKPALIVRESQPVELPPDVVRATERPDYGLEELSNLDVRSRFSVFERANEDDEYGRRELSRSPSGLKRSESILLKMARFERKGNESLGDLSVEKLQFEDSSSEEEEIVDDQVDANYVRASPKKHRERPQSFSAMGDVKSKWESGNRQHEGYQTRKEELAEERKEELQKMRAKLFAGRQIRMKEAYEQAVQEGQQHKDAPKALDVQVEVKAKSIKEIFEKGVDENTPSKPKLQDEMEVFEAATAKESRNLFKQLDQNARREDLGTPLRRSQSQRIASESRQEQHKVQTNGSTVEVVRASDKSEDVEVATADVASRFRFFETFREKDERDAQAERDKPKRVLRASPPRAADPELDDNDSKVSADPEKEAAANTTSKMRNIFRQMEQQAGKEDTPQGPKPLKRFTPPPEYTKESESEGEEEAEDDEEVEEEEIDEEEEEEETGEVKKSAVEDELIQIAKERALAKNLRSKFEHWEDEMEKENRVNRKSPSPLAIAGEDQPSLDTARNLRARFEALQRETAKPAEKARPKVNRFVESPAANADVCGSCSKRVYVMEKMEVTGKTYHRNCFKCTQCSCVLRLENFSLNNGRFYCSPHYKQLFITKGNYDEGFGGQTLAKNWNPKSGPAQTQQALKTPTTDPVVNDEELFDELADSNGHDSALEENLFEE